MTISGDTESVQDMESGALMQENLSALFYPITWLHTYNRHKTIMSLEKSGQKTINEQC